jgi:hypothetical protein
MIDDWRLMIMRVDCKEWQKLHYYGKGPTARQGHVAIAVGQYCLILGGQPFSAVLDVHVSQLGKRELLPFKQAKSIVAATRVKVC